MSILLHVCCAPCLSGSRICFEGQELEYTAYFFNPNIHPWKEFDKRKRELITYRDKDPFDLIVDDSYPLFSFMRGMFDAIGIEKENEDENGFMTQKQRILRCDHCYRKRLVQAARYGKENGFDSFSTTLLLSKYQDHEGLKRICEDISFREGIPFTYFDLREHWSASLKMSRKHGLYRQNYCGCIFSEQERYRKNITSKS